MTKDKACPHDYLAGTTYLTIWSDDFRVVGFHSRKSRKLQEILQAIFLGIVQGATEFIPVSSSGHLVIIPWLLGWERDPEVGLFFDTILHWGTLVAIFVVFWREFWTMFVAALKSIGTRSLTDPQARVAWFIVIGSIPAAFLGLFFTDALSKLYMEPSMAGFAMLVTAGLLAGSELLVKRAQQFRDLDQINLKDSIFIGLAQGFALIPGISRSGSTIAAGLSRGIRRDEAARFSFYLGTPAFLGAGLLQTVDVMSIPGVDIGAMAPALIAGFLAAAIMGIIAIRFLLAYLRKHSLNVFAVYCAVVGLLTIVVSFVR